MTERGRIAVDILALVTLGLTACTATWLGFVVVTVVVVICWAAATKPPIDPDIEEDNEL